MKAGYGIVFREGASHVDMGPTYNDMIKSKPGNQNNLTLSEYKVQHGSSSNKNDYLSMLKQVSD